jgi:hypothetical protein
MATMVLPWQTYSEVREDGDDNVHPDPTSEAAFLCKEEARDE